MAVEAHYPNLFPSQYITKYREVMDLNQAKQNMYNIQMGSGIMPIINACPTTETPPFYQPIVFDSALAKTSMKSESGLTYNNNVVAMAPRKRSRESYEQYHNNYNTNNGVFNNQNKNNVNDFLVFLGQDMSVHLQQEQSSIDRVINQYAEKVKMEINERRKRQSRMFVSAIQEGLMKKLKEKEEEIERIGILNLVLQERVKSLCAENKMWRDLAQSNEETANVLRNNLELVLSHVSDQPPHPAADDAADVESCCASCDGDAAEEKEEEAEVSGKRMCKTCGKMESCVLLLPCRHLCLCTICGSTVYDCPVCQSPATGSVHVEMS